MNGRQGEVPNAAPDDVQVTLMWHADDGGGLVGELRIHNVTQQPVRLANKPQLRPLGLAGQPLDAQRVVTLEGMSPGYVDIGPGEDAVARVGWVAPAVSIRRPRAGTMSGGGSGRWLVRRSSLRDPWWMI